MFQKMPVSSLPSQLSMPNRGCNDCTAVILSCMRSNQYFLPEAAAACRSASSLMGSPHCMASCLKACRYVSSVMSIRHLVPAMNAQAGSSREPCDEKTTPEHQGAISVLIIDKSQIREDFIGDLVDSVLARRTPLLQRRMRQQEDLRFRPNHVVASPLQDSIPRPPLLFRLRTRTLSTRCDSHGIPPYKGVPCRGPHLYRRMGPQDQRKRPPVPWRRRLQPRGEQKSEIIRLRHLQRRHS